MYDPVELMEARQEQLMWEYNLAQTGVPEGMYRCQYCLRIYNYEPIQLNSSPVSPVMCYECLPDDIKNKYDEFEKKK